MSQFDSTDPGLINVADQAYPPIPPSVQGLPVPVDVFGITFAPPFGPPVPLSQPTAVNVDITQAQILSLQSALRFGALPPTEVNISLQNYHQANTEDWVVTESGNFQTNGNGTPYPFTVLHVVVVDTGLPTQAYQIFLTAPVDLTLFGLDLTNFLVSFPVAAPATAPEDVPQRPIISWSTNWIYVSAFDSQGDILTIPGVGNKIQIYVVRDGSQAVYDTDLPIQNFVVPVPQQAALPLLVSFANFLGTFAANAGVQVPFIGSGVPAPPFLGTFEVENQNALGPGLPTNVFV
jgi:hypothetical protein